MNPLDWMQPRDHRRAARTVSVLAGVAATTAILAEPIDRHWSGAAGAAYIVALLGLVLLLAVAVHRFDTSHRVLWAVGPMLSVPVLVVVDLLTEDATVTAQIFFLFPALYGASQLRVKGAVVMAVLSVAGEAVVVFAQLPPRQALVDTWYVAAVIGTTTVLLTTASVRQHRLVKRLEEMAAIDPLTGLATRRVLDEAATSTLSGAGDDAGTALVIIDVDHFKSVNDTWGHPAGDAVLVQLADLLRRHTRGTDVLCRLGGDEIAVLMPACAEGSAVRRSHEILTAVLAHHFRIAGGERLEVSVSVGCAHLPTHATDLRRLYAAADAALYRAKQEGRGRVAHAEVGVR